MKKRRVTDRISDVLEFPRDVIGNLPRIEIIGNGQVRVEGFFGISEYSGEKIAVRVKDGIFSVSGEGLQIDEITEDYMRIKGYINSVEFM